MEAIHTFLNGREKITTEEGKRLLHMVIYHQDSIYQYLTEDDVNNLYPAMQRSGLIEDDLNSDTPQYLLSIMEGVREGVDAKVFVNFLRMMALCVSQKEALHQDVLDQNIDMIFEKMFEYIFEESIYEEQDELLCRVKKFYIKSGYVEFGAVEDDEGCPHIWMKKQL